MNYLNLLTEDRYVSTPALLNDKRWTQAETRELLEHVSRSEVRTAPATHRHQMWALLGKNLSTKRTAKDACNKYRQVCSQLSSASGEVLKVAQSDDVAKHLTTKGANEKNQVFVGSVDAGDVLDQAIADSVDDSKPRRLAFASPPPLNIKNPSSSNVSKTTSVAASLSTSSSSTSSSLTVSTASKTINNKLVGLETTKEVTKKVTKKVTKEVKEKPKVKPTSIGGISIGDTVMVDSRTWPGVNKPGGAGRVTSINMNSTFNIKYMLGGSERGVEPDYVHLRNLTANAGERKRGRRTFYDPINNEAVVPDDDGIVRSKQQEEEEARAREAKAAAIVEGAKEIARLANEVKVLKEVEDKQMREKMNRKSRAALTKKNRKKNNANKPGSSATSGNSKSNSRSSSSRSSSGDVVGASIEQSIVKKKRRRNSSSTDKRGDQQKKNRSRSRSISFVPLEHSTMAEIDLQMRKPPMSAREREMKEYIPPHIEWPSPPVWMNTIRGRPTLFQVAQFVATKKESQDDRQRWLAEVISRKK
jgi:hypothetical protein